MNDAPSTTNPLIRRRRAAQTGTVLSAMLVPPLAGCAVMHLVDAPLNCQQFIGPLLAILVHSVPGVLFGKQGLDLRRQRLGGVDAILQEPQFFHPLSEDLSEGHHTPGLF